MADQNLRLEWIDPKTLTPNPSNWRVHPPAQREALAGVLSEVGWAGALLWNERTSRLVDGHLRLDVALRENRDAVPVLIGNWTDAQEKEILATLDPIAAMAEADSAQLDALLREVNSGSAAVMDMLAGLAEDAGLYLDEKPIGAGGDEFDSSVQEGETRAKRGDLWQLGQHRLLVDDCTIAANVARLMGGDRWQLLVTSPPYNSGNGGYKTDYHGKTKLFYVGQTDDRTEAEWVSFCDDVLNATQAVAEDNLSVVVWNVMYNARCRQGYGKLMFAGTHPFTVKETICWDKGMGFPTASKGILSRNWELVFILSKGEKYFTTQGENEPRWAKWDIPRPREQDETHRATYPVEFAERAITDFSPSGAVVLDPFSGSGTTLIACERLGRKCYGTEIEPRYADVIIRRYEAETGQTAQLVERVTDE